MNRVDYARLEIRRCPTCGGTYVDEGVFHTLQRRREARVTGPDVPQMQPHPEEPVRCPRCNLEMRKIPYTEGSDITVDKCQSCQGYWFDKGELQAVQVVYRNMQDDARRRRARTAARKAGSTEGPHRMKVAWSVIATVLVLLAALAWWQFLG
jgi:Zn-finger nucleic acid-binding protein